MQAGARRVRITHPDKVLYPATGTTKAAVVDYYARVAGVLLPHLQDRPLTLQRYPAGVGGRSFFVKHAPRRRPEWVATVELASAASGREGRRVEHLLATEVATLVWLANLDVLELHVPMWRVEADPTHRVPDLMVFDLDPGPPAGLVQCCQVALRLRDALVSGWVGYPKTSGRAGLQVYVPLAPEQPWQQVHGYARDLAQRLEREGGLVVSRMRKDLRAGKVLIDWSQNNPAKTTVAVYSLRGGPEPTVSTPVSWAEVRRCARSGDPGLLRFGPEQVLARVAARGDLFAGASRRGTAVVPEHGG